MEGAAEEVDDAVRRLGGGKIPPGLGVGGVGSELPRPRATVVFPLAGGEELKHRPGFAFVEGQRRIQPITPEFIPIPPPTLLL